MEFSYQIAIVLKQTLEKQGIYRLFPVYSHEFLVYTPEELEQITELELTGISNLDGLEYLSNLKKLSILSVDFTYIDPTINLDVNPGVNSIQDFSVISKLINLEELSIQNDTYIRRLDISPLKNLKNLLLINNPELETLIGLDQLTNLENVFMYGTQISSPLDIEQYMENTIATKKNILDINMYASIVKGDRNVSKSINDNTLLGKTNILFGEYIGFLDVSILDPASATDMYTKLDILFRKNQLYEKTDLEKIEFVYNYMIRNVKFDQEGLEERQKEYEKLKQDGQEVPNYMKKNFASLHNSYIAFRFKRVNCEGFVNLMKFMLNMLGIKCINVHCIDRRFENIFTPNHSLIRVLCNGSWYYCDPTYDRKEPEKYFMKTYEELQNSHGLNPYEDRISKETPHEQHITANIK